MNGSSLSHVRLLSNGLPAEAEQLGCRVVDGGAGGIVGGVLHSAEFQIGQFVVYRCERTNEGGSRASPGSLSPSSCVTDHVSYAAVFERILNGWDEYGRAVP